MYTVTTYTEMHHLLCRNILMHWSLTYYTTYRSSHHGFVYNIFEESIKAQVKELLGVQMNCMYECIYVKCQYTALFMLS